MSEPYQRRVSVKVDADIYDAATKHLYHGQLSHLIRGFMEAIVMLEKEDRQEDLIRWAYHGDTLDLPEINPES